MRELIISLHISHIFCLFINIICRKLACKYVNVKWFQQILSFCILMAIRKWLVKLKSNQSKALIEQLVKIKLFLTYKILLNIHTQQWVLKSLKDKLVKIKKLSKCFRKYLKFCWLSVTHNQIYFQPLKYLKFQRKLSSLYLKITEPISALIFSEKFV